MVVRATPATGLWLSRAVQSTIALVAIAAIVAMQKTQLSRPTLNQETSQQAEQHEKIKLGVLKKLPNLGFNNLISDWAFLSYLQYYGDDEARQQTGYALIPQYFDVVTQRDPRFVDIYLFLSGTLSHQLGQPQLSAQYIKRGTDALSPKLHPRAFMLWRHLGLDQLLLMGDVPGAIKSHKMAAEWAAGSSDPDARSVAKVFELTAQFLSTDPDSRPIRFNAWSTIFAQAVALNDAKTQARAKQEIIALGGVEKVDKQGRTFFTLASPPRLTTPPVKTPLK